MRLRERYRSPEYLTLNPLRSEDFALFVSKKVSRHSLDMRVFLKYRVSSPFKMYYFINTRLYILHKATGQHRAAARRDLALRDRRDNRRGNETRLKSHIYRGPENGGSASTILQSSAFGACRRTCGRLWATSGPIQSVRGPQPGVSSRRPRARCALSGA